ncbi:hypothetical protein LSUE1_G001531 [Lachnellula suecica]|uniref:SnoaL-like polyketide cyclase n=1 Tax=Lachnellula suecica TaxID=602035 RepID=A0A8T9CK96_9HELO|nr:hypothetical protein LSUE1_G001531 [Lachnellula suecica]
MKNGTEQFLKSFASGSAMSSNSNQTLQEQNKQVVARYFEEFWARGNLSIVDELCADDVLSNYPRHGPRRGKVAVKRMLEEFKDAFPNTTLHQYGPIPMIAEENYVVIRWIGGGMHSGLPFSESLAGSLDTTNTGNEFHFFGTTIFTLQDGKIIEEIGEEGSLTALQQLGLVQPADYGSGNGRQT